LKVITRVDPVHLMNADLRQPADDLQTKSTDLCSGTVHGMKINHDITSFLIRVAYC